MVMNKAERAHVEALETRLAFAWPNEAEPQRTVMEGIGWDMNHYARDVYQGKRTGASQNRRPLYATFEEARLALRWALCREYAKQLRDVERMTQP
jgi:hypothetical protein